MIAIVLLSSVAFGLDSDSHEHAIEAELKRAMDELVLPDQARPHHITVTLATGNYATVRAQDGAITEAYSGPSRDLRVDVRVGDPTFDNGNFRPSMGIPDGISSRHLAHEHSANSLRRDL